MNKKITRLMSVSLLSLLLVFSAGQKARAQGDVTVSYQSFYDNLAPYGQWVNDQQYGNVWVPNEGGDFRPYGSRGHWVMTDYGNTWVSDDPWGWACYHYGRWTYNGYYGWVWIPGYEWAPAWVSWRFGGDQCGWAPLGPGASVGSYSCPDSWWVFIGPQHMYEPNCYSYWRGPQYNGGYLRQTTIVNNYYVDNGTHVRYNYGPRAEAIQQVTHQPVQVYRVSGTSRPGAPNVNGRNVSLYRPAVNRSTVGSARPGNVIQAPRSVGKPQAAGAPAAGHQPAFRQDAQKLAPNAGHPGNTNAQNGARPGTPASQNAGRGNNQQGNKTQPANNAAQGRAQQGNNAAQGRPQTQPQGRPQQGSTAAPGRTQTQQQNRPQGNNPAQGRPQQQNRPQQPAQQNHMQQAPQNRPQPMQQSRPQQQQARPQQAAPQQHEQARPQQAAPQQHEAPHEEAPRGGGERR